MKKLFRIVLSFALILSLSACGEKKTQEAVPAVGNEGMINIYYPVGNTVVRDEAQYQIKQPDSISASVEEVMAALMEKLQDTMTYYTYMLDVDNNVTLEFAMLEDAGKEYGLLADASIAKTLFQIDGINGVDIKVSDVNGKVIEDKLYTRNSIFFYDYEDSELNKRRVKLYYENEDGTGLTSSYFYVHTSANVSVQESIIEALSSINTIPEGTSVNAVIVSSGVCYLDLSHEFADGVTKNSGSVLVYSVVNSITSLDNIEQVQLLIDGEIVSAYRGINDISAPLSFNEEIVE